MEMNMCNGLYELDEAEMYAIDGGIDPGTVAIIKTTFKVAKCVGTAGLVVAGAGLVIGIGYELIFGE